jgi:putative photosynthetic complex assembly protein
MKPFPKGALYGAGALIAFSFVLVGGSRLLGYKMDWVPEAVAVADRQISFTRTADGGVTVADAKTGDVLGTWPHDTNAFVRTVMLGLMHDRSAVAPDDRATPFRLTRWHDGRVSVSDPVSGRSVELAAFGRSQVETFERLLD